MKQESSDKKCLWIKFMSYVQTRHRKNTCIETSVNVDNSFVMALSLADRIKCCIPCVCLSVPPSVRQSVPCLRFSRNRKAVETNLVRLLKSKSAHLWSSSFYVRLPIPSHYYWIGGLGQHSVIDRRIQLTTVTLVVRPITHWTEIVDRLYTCTHAACMMHAGLLRHQPRLLFVIQRLQFIKHLLQVKMAFSEIHYRIQCCPHSTLFDMTVVSG